MLTIHDYLRGFKDQPLQEIRKGYKVISIPVGYRSFKDYLETLRLNLRLIKRNYTNSNLVKAYEISIEEAEDFEKGDQ